MPCQIKNPANYDLKGLEPHIHGMYDHFASKYGFKKPPVMVFDSDPSNQSKVLGKTAYYDPQSFEVHVFVDGRHPKDVLRSIAHELIHHKQNLEGRLDVGGYTGPGYYLENDDLKEVEHEAMLEGNATMREYEDTRKYKENKDMSLKEWKNNELNQLLLKKFGILKEEKKKMSMKGSDPENYPEGADSKPKDGKISSYEATIAKKIADNETNEELDESFEPPEGSFDLQKKIDRDKEEARKNKESGKDKPVKQKPDGTYFSEEKELGEASCGTGDKKRMKETDNKLEESLRRIINAKKITFRNKRVK